MGRKMINNKDINIQLTIMITIGIIASVVLYVFGYYGKGDYEYTLGHYIGRDFVNMYMGGKLALNDNLSALGNIKEYNQFILKEFGWPHGDISRDFFTYSYPPHMILMNIPFGTLNYTTGLYLWTLLSLIILYYAAENVTQNKHALAALIILSPGFLSNMFQANTGAIFGAILALSLLNLEKRPIASGIFMGLLSLKPQLTIVPAIITLFTKNWKALAAAGMTFITLIGATYIILGPEPFLIFINYTLKVQLNIMRDLNTDQLFSSFVVSPFTLFYRLGLPYTWAMVLQWAIAIIAIAFALIVWLSPINKQYKIAIALIASTFTTPYINHYDLSTLSLAVLAYYTAKKENAHIPDNDVIMLILWVFPSISLLMNLNIFIHKISGGKFNSSLLLIIVFMIIIITWIKYLKLNEKQI